MSIQDATGLMLLVAATVGTAVGVKGVWVRRQRRA
jgi:hypothetical protein